MSKYEVSWKEVTLYKGRVEAESAEGAKEAILADPFWERIDGASLKVEVEILEVKPYMRILEPKNAKV